MLIASIIQLFLLTPVFCSQGYVKLEFDIRTGVNLFDAINGYFNGVGIRNNDVQVNISNQRSFYIANLKLGSAKTNVGVLLDTGSSDLWVMSSKNSYCANNGGNVNCDTYGTYDETTSSTFHNNNTQFSITYLDQTFAKGTWGQDTIGIGDDLTLQGGNLAVADNSDSNIGVFGIGPRALESASSQYDNLPIQMKQQGFINKVAYSLYLTPAESERGTILFGGIDHAKYLGSLQEFDIVLNNGQFQYLQIGLDSIEVNDKYAPVATTLINVVASPTPGISNDTVTNDNSKVTPINVKSINVAVNAVFDSGTTLTYLPQQVVTQILDTIAPNASYNNNIGGYQVPCTLRRPGSYISYKFGSKAINVAFTEVVLDVGPDNRGNEQCMLGIIASSQTILGDNFLRSCYSVFNLDDRTLSIAQMNYNDAEAIDAIN